MSTASDILVQADADRGLYLTVFISGCIHLGVLGLLAFAHPNFLEHPKVESYTVDLISPSAVGGTNLHPGAGQAPKPAPPKAAAQPAVPLPPPPAVARPEPAPEPKAPEAPPPEKVEVKPPPPAPPPPKPAEVKPEPKPEAVAVKPEPKVEQKPEPKPPPKPEVAAKPKPNPPPEAAKSTQPEKVSKPTKPEPPKPVEAKKEPVKAERPPEPDRDRKIADAVGQRAKQVHETESGASKSLDNRIEAAIQRRAQAVASGNEPGSGNGPISSGPGTGSGGIVKGVEYILYRNQMEARIKAAWAWAGANRSLKAMVRFNILPSGEIANVQVIEPSGDPGYDTSIERALRAVSPLDPPPEQYRQEFSTVELEFRPEDIKL